MMLAIETREMYLRADMDLASESGNIKQTVVTTAWMILKVVIP
jgi:hypothetical protein